MDIGLMINNLYVLIFLFLFLVPQIQKYLLRLRRIAKIRKSTVITLNQGQETVRALFGIPLARYIDIDDS